MTKILCAFLSCLSLAGAVQAQSPRAVVDKPSITMAAALEIAQSVLAAGKKNGTDLAVVVVDRAGLPLVVLRADNGTEQFVTGATRKAWTAVNFRDSTRNLFEDIQKNKEDFSQLPTARNALFLMGGVPLKVNDQVVGGIGVAGAVSGLEDDELAKKGAAAFAKMAKKPKSD